MERKQVQDSFFNHFGMDAEEVGQMKVRMENQYDEQFNTIESKMSYMCYNCHKVLTKKEKKRCGKCKRTYYCGTACQTKDWPRHKKICKEQPKPDTPTKQSLARMNYVLRKNWMTLVVLNVAYITDVMDGKAEGSEPKRVYGVIMDDNPSAPVTDEGTKNIVVHFGDEEDVKVYLQAAGAMKMFPSFKNMIGELPRAAVQCLYWDTKNGRMITSSTLPALPNTEM